MTILLSQLIFSKFFILSPRTFTQKAQDIYCFFLNSLISTYLFTSFVLLHLLLTNKGERLYLPDFGSDLKKYIFEPNDSITHEQIKDNLNENIKRYIPNLIINDITFKNNNIEELIIVELTYTVTDGTFNSTDTVTLTF